MRTLGLWAFGLLAAAPLAAQNTVYPPPGGTVLSAPRIIPVWRPAAVRLSVGAVIAEQRIELEDERYRSDRRIHPGDLAIDLLARSRFILWRGAGPDRYCELHYPLQMYEAPVDENDVAYYHVCAVDLDRDGRFETLRLVPAPGRPWRDLPIPPVRFMRERGPPEAWLPPYRLTLRLRVSAVSAASASVVAEYGMSDEMNWRFKTAPGSSPLVLPLRPGASGRLAGLTLRVGGAPGRPTLSARGTFSPWFHPAPNRTGFTAGPHRVP
ncbi:MAG TPA: hypothetical protein VGO55_17685 [Allosphingosinicella sp.]|jgi:hypothetical protein|nr:hypothetical protein [Allosphingosinicella sp.]